METLKRIILNPIVTGILGLLVGIFIGLVILGWWLYPVQWTNASPADLSPDTQVAFLRTCIDAYGYNGDAAQAKACYDSLGEGAAAALQQIVQDPAPQDPKLVAAFGSIALEGGVSLTPIAEQSGEVQAPESGAPEAGATAFALPQGAGETQPSGGGSSWLTFICVGGLIIAAILALLYLLNRFGVLSLGGTSRTAAEDSKGAEAPIDYSAEEIPPISRNIAAYQLGNDLFDEVYSIESDGEFLGEYGAAIADYTGVGGPKKVSAFEVWLFDKNHIPTTTRVLMSEQAYADTGKRQKLEAKGETLLAEPDRPVVLETNTLRLVARLIDMNYAQGAAGTYFERFVLELKVFQLG
jgi:hypothetical protein